MKNKYYEVTIKFNKKNTEELYNNLYKEGIESILEEDDAVKIYFPEDKLKELNSMKKNLIKNKVISLKDFSSEKFEDKSWNDDFEKNIEPVNVRNKIIIHPSWKKNVLKNTEGKILIEIDPKMSFGTGHNETTQLVLELMCDFVNGDEEKLLDFGTGTGILAIAGVKLGINSAVAIDIDDESIENAKENFEKNSVNHKIRLKKSKIHELDEDSFDVIVVNIIRSVIVENIEHIADKINSKGKLFLSGILMSEDQEILEHLTQHEFEIQDIFSKSEWMGIFATKR